MPIILHRGQFRIRVYTSSLFQSSDADDDSRNMNWKEVYLMRTKLCKYTCGMEQQHHGVRHWAVLSSPVLLSPSRSVAQSSHLLGLLRLHPPPSICQQHIHELRRSSSSLRVLVHKSVYVPGWRGLHRSRGQDILSPRDSEENSILFCTQGDPIHPMVRV